MSTATAATSVYDDSNCYRWMFGFEFICGLRPYRLHLESTTAAAAAVQHNRRPRRLRAILYPLGLFAYISCITVVTVSFGVYYLSDYFGSTADSTLGLTNTRLGNIQGMANRIANWVHLAVLFAQLWTGTRRACRMGDLLRAADRQLECSEHAAGDDEQLAQRMQRQRRERWLMEALRIWLFIWLSALTLGFWYFSLRVARSVKWALARIFLVTLPKLMKQISLFSYVYQLSVLTHRMSRLNGVLERRLQRLERGQGVRSGT